MARAADPQGAPPSHLTMPVHFSVAFDDKWLKEGAMPAILRSSTLRLI